MYIAPGINWSGNEEKNCSRELENEWYSQYHYPVAQGPHAATA